MIKLDDKQEKALKGYKFVDLFCGIGGFHLALASFGAECVFASDINSEARKVYEKNFGKEPSGDIIKIKESDIPKHDILCGGFPCQAFSVSGKGKGFDDPDTGMLFYEIARIAKEHKPKFIILENVANFEVHDDKKSLQRVYNELESIGYAPYHKVLNARDYGVPQYRRRIYIVGVHKDLDIGKFEFPQKQDLKITLENLLDNDEKAVAACVINREYTLRTNYQEIEKKCKKAYIRIGEIGKGRQGERIYSPRGCATTLSSSSGGLGGRTGMYYIDEKNRKLTPRECARLMGFPESYQIADAQNQAYKQFGNSVVVDVLQNILKKIIEIIGDNGNGN